MGWDVCHPVSSKEVVHALVELAEAEGSYLCRGEPRLYQTGTPSIAREREQKAPLVESVLQSAEPHLIAHFRARIGPHLSPNEIELTRTIWGTLVLMQHYRAPTRLLDWSLSPFVAAFFAAISDPEQDGYLFAIRLEDVKSTPSEDDALRSLIGARRLVEWQNRIQTILDRHPNGWLAALRPMRATSRMVAQQSYFTIGIPASLDHRQWLAHHVRRSPHKRVIIIPQAQKPDLLHVLSRMNITSAALYPDLVGIGESIGDVIRYRLPMCGSPEDDWVSDVL